MYKVEVKDEVRPAESEIGFIPTLNAVLVKMEYTLPFMALGNDKIKPDNPIFTVAGYGSKTSSVSIGDFITLSADYRNITAALVNVPNNKLSWAYYATAHKALSSDKAKLALSRQEKYIIRDYLVIPEYAITAIVPKESDLYEEAVTKVKAKLKEKEACNLFRV